MWFGSLLCYKQKNKTMKVLVAGKDFVRAEKISPKVGEKFLIKQSIATGWGHLAKVTRVTKTQVEVEVVNLVPTEETNRFGTKNGLKDRHQGFFEVWCWRKKASVGKKFKFFKDSCVMVGDSENHWNPCVLTKLLNV